MSISKEAFRHFKGVYELKCSWVVDDDYYDEIIKPQLDLMKWAIFRCEFAFKCLYPNEKPLSKEDYGRIRYTHRKICTKRNGLAQVRTKSEDESFQRNMRRLKIQKGIYPTGMSFEEALENEEIKKYYEEGKYKPNTFVAKCIVPLNHL